MAQPLNELNLSLTAPLEGLAIEALRAVIVFRQTQDPEIQKEWDSLGLQLVKPIIQLCIKQLEKALASA
jgi:hypothetical protein